MTSVNEITSFSTALAVELGNAYLAMLVQFFCNVINHHKRMNRNFKDGRTWNYCTRADLAGHFPFLNPTQIKHCLSKLIKMGILKVGNYNKRKGDNTQWYAFVDEVKYGISKQEEQPKEEPVEMEEPPESDEGSDKIVRGSDKFIRGSDKNVRALPQTKHRLKPPAYKVNDSDAGAQAAPLAEVVGSAAPSLTQSIKKKTSLFKGKATFSDEQRFCLEWLKTLQLDTEEDTLSWWARTYPMMRLDEVHREAVKRNPASVGAYMHKLLKKQAIVVSGRIELNAEFAKEFKAMYQWSALELHPKYALVKHGNHEIEIDFNMEHEAFKDYLFQKYDNLNRKL